jgi:AcrR family transcriptional regulator
MNSQQATPERLRDAAWQVIRDEGLNAATSRRITDAAGANLGAITYHFGSKDALVADALVSQFQEWAAPLTSAIAQGDGDAPTIDARNAAAVQVVLGMFAARSGELVALLRAAMTTDLPEVKDAFTRGLAEFRGVVADAMVEQQAAGMIPDTVVPEAMAGVFTAFGIGLVAQAAIDGAPPDTVTMVAQFLSLLRRPEV